MLREKEVVTVAVEKKYYLIKDGIVYFNDYIVEVNGEDFKGKSLMEIHLGEKTTRIGAETFANNYFRSITFHKKIKFIEDLAFSNNRLETLVFERKEAPVIAPNAFNKNPIKHIIVPYAGLKEYNTILAQVDLPETVIVMSDVEKKFDDLKAEQKPDEVIFLETRTIYGELYWKVNKSSEFDLKERLAKDCNENNFTNVTLKGNESCCMHTDDRFDLILYKNEGQSMTFSDFVELYYDKDACQC